MRKSVFYMWFILFCSAAPVIADQRVVVPVDGGEGQPSALERGFDAALAQEVQVLVGTPLSPSRLKAVMSVLSAERNTFVRGYSEVAGGSANATEGNANATATDANATSGASLAVDVRIHAEGLKTRLRELGVMFTASAPLPYVLELSGVEPSRTKRLGALQELSGLKPLPVGAADVPVLKLSQMGAWTGVLSLGEWNATHSAKTLDEVWLAVWKSYFSRPGILAKGESGLLVRVSGWLSSMGPMEFDRLMDSWSDEIQYKTLVGVEMDGPGMVGVWRVQTRSRDALARRLGDAAKAQGLTLEIR